MPKETIQILGGSGPTRSTRAWSGTVTWIKIGDRRVKCLRGPDPTGRLQLIHCASGQALISAGYWFEAHLSLRMSEGRAPTPERTQREAVARLLQRLPASQVLRVIDAAPVINGAEV